MGTPEPELITLTEAARRLGVHYMTVYRYVRVGDLPARKADGRWWVTDRDLQTFSAPRAPRLAASPPVRWSARMVATLLAGDEAASWRVVEGALASGHSPQWIHEEVLAPAMRSIGEAWRRGEIGIGDEHIATAVATRVVGRLSGAFRVRGPSRARVVVGTPPGDRHSLAILMVADQLRGGGFDAVDLGCDIPVEAFCDAVATRPTRAVAIGVTWPGALEAAGELVGALRSRFPDVSIIVGGGATSLETAHRLGADGFAASGSAAVELCRALPG